MGRPASWVRLTPPVGPISYRGKSCNKPNLSVQPLPCQSTTSPSCLALAGQSSSAAAWCILSPSRCQHSWAGYTPFRSHPQPPSVSTQEVTVQQEASSVTLLGVSGPPVDLTQALHCPLPSLTVSTAAGDGRQRGGVGEDQDRSAGRQGAHRRKHKGPGTEMSEELHCNTWGRSFNLGCLSFLICETMAPSACFML